MKRAESPARTNATGEHRDTATGRTWWSRLRRPLILLFFAAVVVLLVRFGSQVQWHTVWTSVRANSPIGLLMAAALAAISHALVASYDLIGRRTTGHGLSVPRVLSVAWVAYAFNLNLGALVGGVGFRFRLYSRLGLDAAVIGQVYVLSVVTNWLGYLVLIGTILLLAPDVIPAEWRMGRAALATLGVLIYLIALAYLLFCAFAPPRRWQWRGHGLTLPSGTIAMVQLLVSMLNWLAMAGVITILLGHKIAFPVVLGVMLVAAVAGAVSHVPAGLGVLEAVFIALLGHEMPQNDILAALLTYRAIYYLAPLSVALVSFAIMEAGRRKPSRAHAKRAG